NIGTSPAYPELDQELEKLKVCIDHKADAVMDLSTGGDINLIRREIIKRAPMMIGTVPIYQAAIDSEKKYGSNMSMTADDIFEAIETQAQDGIDFMTVHCGVTLKSVEILRKSDRVMGVVSRGGAILASWIVQNLAENPLYAQYARLLEIAAKYDITLSLGDGFRPGCLHDATDRAQIAELNILGELTERAWKAGVQVIVEGPGHVPYDQIEANMKIQKRVCKGAPFYVLGPLVTDVAAGYDHISGAIGGTLAAISGADFLCYVTPSEHLGLPDAKDVRDGIVASKIAAHAADIVLGIPGAKEWDLAMSKARKSFNWEEQIRLSIDPEKARAIRLDRNHTNTEECSMCGEYCAYKMDRNLSK
ncbi:MAG: phosphomethylpyrimidine synthase ThiC, partial [bacterium]